MLRTVPREGPSSSNRDRYCLVELGPEKGQAPDGVGGSSSQNPESSDPPAALLM